MMKYIVVSLLFFTLFSCSQEEYEGILNIEISNNSIFSKNSTITQNIELSNDLEIGYSFVTGKFIYEFYKRGNLELNLLAPDTISRKITLVPSKGLKENCFFIIDNGNNEYRTITCSEVDSTQTELIDKISKIKLSFSVLASTGKKRVFVLSANIDDKHLLADGKSVNISGDFSLNLFLRPVINVSGVTKNSSNKNEGNVDIDVYPAITTKIDDGIYRFDRKFSLKSDSSGKYSLTTVFDKLDNSLNDLNSLYFNYFLVATKGSSVGFSLPGKINSYDKNFLKDESLIKKIACSQIEMGGDSVNSYFKTVCDTSTITNKKICEFYNEYCVNTLTDRCIFSPLSFRTTEEALLNHIDDCMGDQIGELYPTKNISNLSLVMYDKIDILNGEPLISTLYLPKITSLLDLENIGRDLTDNRFSDINRLIYEEISLLNEKEGKTGKTIYSGSIFLNGFNLDKLFTNESFGEPKGFKIEYIMNGENYTLRYDGAIVFYTLPKCYKLEKEEENCNSSDFIFDVIQNKNPFFTLTKGDNRVVLPNLEESFISILVPNTIDMRLLYDSIDIQNIYFIYNVNGETVYRLIFEKK
ncbi:hypothetical protein JXR93_13985 [bacterium]|nr:hypothetical protein [bacterium]